MNSRAVLLVLLAATLACGPERTAEGQVVKNVGRPLAAGDWPNVLSLGGEWKYRDASLLPAEAFRTDFNDRSWQTAHVPSNWFLQGIDQSGAIWFRREFPGPPGAGAQTALVFEGVDYAADVWLNDHYLGFHEGYFDRFSFGVGGLLRTSAPNVLAVRVNSPLEPGRAWSLHKRQIKGVFGHHDARPGNAWSERGQDQNTGGIWGDVYLKIVRDVSLDAVRVLPTPMGSGTDSPIDDGAPATALVDLDVTNGSASPRAIRIQVSIAPQNFASSPDTAALVSLDRVVPPGTSHVSAPVNVRNARLWWMWEHGAPNLYRADVTVSDAGAVLDRGQRTFGFRTITFDPKSGDWRLNGRRVFLRGTNYIASQWLSEMTPDRYRLDLALMRQAGINAIRVHAHVEGQELYRQADENGLLVWQDFPLQWGYEDSEELRAEALRQAVAMIEQLGNHPSIATWSGHNEPPWDADWMKYKYPDYSPLQNRALDKALAAAMSRRDPTRHVHTASTTGEHQWLGWYSGTWQDFAKPTAQPLITEFGAQALPDLSTLRRFIPEADLWPTTEEGWRSWTFHDFQPHETFDLAHVEKGGSTEELIANTQAYQARLVQFAAESYRRQRHAPVGAIFQFMFNECWPSADWGIVDYWRQPKAGFRALATAYQPVLPSIAWVPSTLHEGDHVDAGLWVVNDLWRAFEGATLSWTLRSAERVVTTDRVTVDIAADSGREVARFRASPAAGRYTLAVALRDVVGREIGHNAWTFEIEAR